MTLGNMRESVEPPVYSEKGDDWATSRMRCHENRWTLSLRRRVVPVGPETRRSANAPLPDNERRTVAEATRISQRALAVLSGCRPSTSRRLRAIGPPARICPALRDSALCARIVALPTAYAVRLGAIRNATISGLRPIGFARRTAGSATQCPVREARNADGRAAVNAGKEKTAVAAVSSTFMWLVV